MLGVWMDMSMTFTVPYGYIPYFSPIINYFQGYADLEVCMSNVYQTRNEDGQDNDIMETEWHVFEVIATSTVVIPQ